MEVILYLIYIYICNFDWVCVHVHVCEFLMLSMFMLYHVKGIDRLSILKSSASKLYVEYLRKRNLVTNLICWNNSVFTVWNLLLIMWTENIHIVCLCTIHGSQGHPYDCFQWGLMYMHILYMYLNSCVIYLYTYCIRTCS